ncbi:MAG TPA: hypothetical protein VE861_03575 [Gemmatimonadaceae bacterium]|nr:hypothetical protein [Gemmatimonadaceae bacterium]
MALQVNAVDMLTAEVGRSTLSRRMVAQDVLRGRTASAARIGEAFADAASHGADPVHVLAIGERIASWFRSLLHTARQSLVECWERETREQVEADLAQRRAMASNDPHVLAHALQETDEHIAAAQLLRDALEARHALLIGKCA